MATPRGAQAVRDDRHGFARIHWQNWSPPGWYNEATFDRVARSFDTPPLARKAGESLAARFFQQSSWATHTVALGRQVVRVPDGIDADLMGPLGCSISRGAGTILNELQPRTDSSVAIFGCGNVGLAAVMAARLSPATTIIAVDENPERLALARALGAIHAVSGGGAVEEIRDITDGALDYAMETTDGANLVADAVQALGIRGVCAVVGGAKATAKISVAHEDLLLSGKTVRGIMGGGGSTPVSTWL